MTESARGSADFEAAAEEVCGPPPVAARAEMRSVPEDDDPQFPLGDAKSAPDETLNIQPDWARGAAKLCFYPLARYDHPAWALTEEEAAAIEPKMMAFLQAVSNRYMPSALARVANRAPELLVLLTSMGVIFFRKYQTVSRIRAEEAEKSAHVAATDAGKVRTIDHASPPPVESLLCEQCGQSFAGADALARHLPCPGKQRPVS